MKKTKRTRKMYAWSMRPGMFFEILSPKVERGVFLCLNEAQMTRAIECVMGTNVGISKGYIVAVELGTGSFTYVARPCQVRRWKAPVLVAP